MAKRTTTAIVRAQPIPTIRLAMPRAAPMVRVQRRKGGHRRAPGAGGGVTPIKVGITAAVVGMAEKSGILDNLPEIPVVGRKGALAIATYYWARHGGGQIARDICIVTAALCGYEFGKEGSISG